MNGIRASLLMAGLVLAVGVAEAKSPATANDAELLQRVERVLAKTPLIDGHNDLPWELRAREGHVDLNANHANMKPPADAPSDWLGLMTDIPRLRAGHIGGQFWSVWIPTTTTGPEAIKTTIEQIDIVHNMVAQYPQTFQMAYTADDIVRIHKVGRIASLIGIEGGHQIDNSMATLRQMYVLGVRYMTLTHTLNTDWADSATANPQHNGLTGFGRAVIGEMNRLGMIVDLSHVSAKTMKDAIAASRSPVMFSHSGARGLIDHPRGVPDEVLKLVAQNHGIVMVNFFPSYISQERACWDADHAAEETRYNSPPYYGLYIGQPERAAAAMAEWERLHPRPTVTLAEVADHLDYIRKIAGIESVGLGSDFDGISSTPDGLDGVDKYPALLVELARRGWSDADLAALAGGNMLRVMRANEAVAKKLQASEVPSMAKIGDNKDAAKH
ncbi:MAG TPA: dipeptidase [Dokdonella sp.]|uniref:dipeptidase n=1 Tax=Dokdonella sp. TaxID=2291710 RepID=UPI002D802147|nr:dipeptidase [Dokdonella sp.]HET9032723.1 dipeptidase [Dokdonella sp.]